MGPRSDCVVAHDRGLSVVAGELLVNGISGELQVHVTGELRPNTSPLEKPE